MIKNLILISIIFLDKTISRGEFDKIYEDYHEKVQEMYGGNGVDKD